MDRAFALVEQLAEENVEGDPTPASTLQQYIDWAKLIVKDETGEE